MPNDKPLTSVNAIEAYSIPSELPMLVTSEVVIYPLMAAPLLLEDERAVKAAQAAIDAGHKVIAIFGELEESDAEEDIRRESLYPVGTAIYIARSAEMPDGRTCKVLRTGHGATITHRCIAIATSSHSTSREGSVGHRTQHRIGSTRTQYIRPVQKSSGTRSQCAQRSRGSLRRPLRNISQGRLHRLTTQRGF